MLIWTFNVFIDLLIQDFCLVTVLLYQICILLNSMFGNLLVNHSQPIKLFLLFTTACLPSINTASIMFKFSVVAIALNS